jgi:hypothetical protein
MRSALTQTCFTLFAIGLASGYLVDPPTTASPDTNPLCSYWQIAEDSWNDCNPVAQAWLLPITLVGQWVGISARTNVRIEANNLQNPSCKETAKFVQGNSYCVEVNWGMPEPL